jgi:hypothetical protein
MNHSSPATVSSLPLERNRATGANRKEDLVYQAVTVAAMVTLLVSVWVF